MHPAVKHLKKRKSLISTWYRSSEATLSKGWVTWGESTSMYCSLKPTCSYVLENKKRGGGEICLFKTFPFSKDQLWFWPFLQNPEVSLPCSWHFLIGTWELFFYEMKLPLLSECFFIFLQAHVMSSLHLTGVRYLNLAPGKLNAWIK